MTEQLCHGGAAFEAHHRGSLERDLNGELSRAALHRGRRTSYRCCAAGGVGALGGAESDRGVGGRMQTENVAVFFYGLFMDKALLASRGIIPSRAIVGYVDGYGLRIGRRATLVPDETNRAYGVLMTIPAEDVRALYSDDSVVDYVSEFVSVGLSDGSIEPAVCYNLPASKLEGTNSKYANSLLILAEQLGLPSGYLQQIRRQAG